MAENTLEDIVTTFAKVKEFVDTSISISMNGGENNVMSSTRKAALVIWTLYYCSTINVQRIIVQRLLPLVRQCEKLETETLKSSKIHLCHQVDTQEVIQCPL